mgnify:FL=1
MTEKYGWECYWSEISDVDDDEIYIIAVNRLRKRYYYSTRANYYILDSVYEDGQPLFEAKHVSRLVIELLHGYAVENEFKRQSRLPVLPAQGKERAKKGKRLPKELIWKGIRCELTEKEIGDICQQTPFEEDDYYDFGAIVRAVSMYREGAISPEYFQSWCILMQCLYYSPKGTGGELAGLYGALAWIFDGEAFNILGATPREREENARSLLAKIKWSNFRIEKQKKGERGKGLFGKKDRYLFLLWDYYNGGSPAEVWRVFFLDKKNKRFDLFYCDDLLFDDGQDYMFPDESEFEELASIYYDYRLDRSLGEQFRRGQAELKSRL